MQTVVDSSLQQQIEQALKRAKDKKVLYLYDDAGYKRLLGVFEKKKASRIKRQLKSQRLLNRVTEFDIRTTEPDSRWG
jgi:transcription antitermination factor NusA-like protein